MPALKPATIGQKFLTDCGQNRPLTTIYFDTGKIKHKDYPSVIAHTRNYYIHYDESIKENYNVLSEDELEIYNRSLLQILEYYILLEIGFSDEDNLKKSLTERWGCISEELELMD